LLWKWKKAVTSQREFTALGWVIHL